MSDLQFTELTPKTPKTLKNPRASIVLKFGGIVVLCSLLYAVVAIYSYWKDTTYGRPGFYRSFRAYIEQSDLLLRVQTNRVQGIYGDVCGKYAVWCTGDGIDKFLGVKSGTAYCKWELFNFVADDLRARSWSEVQTICLVELRLAGSETHTLTRLRKRDRSTSPYMTTYATDGTYRTNLPIYNAKCWIIDRNTKNILGYKEFDSKHSIIQTTANIVTDVTELMPGSGAQWSSVEDISYRTAHDALYWAGKSVAASLSVQRTRRDILDLEAAYHKNPRDVRVLLQLASAYYRAGQGDRTPSLCDNFLKSNDSTVRDMLAVAYFYLTKEEFSRGFAVLDLIHQRFPQDSQACYEFAALCGSVPNSPKGFALDALDMAINIDPQLRNKVRNDARFMFLRDRARYKLMIGLD